MHYIYTCALYLWLRADTGKCQNMVNNCFPLLCLFGLWFVIFTPLVTIKGVFAQSKFSAVTPTASITSHHPEGAAWLCVWVCIPEQVYIWGPWWFKRSWYCTAVCSPFRPSVMSHSETVVIASQGTLWIVLSFFLLLAHYAHPFTVIWYCHKITRMDSKR